MAAANAEAAAENALVLGDDPSDAESIASGTDSHVILEERTPRTSRRSSISLGDESSRLSERSKNMTSSARGLRAVLAQGTLRAQATAAALEDSAVVEVKKPEETAVKIEIPTTSSSFSSSQTITAPKITPILKNSSVKLPPIAPYAPLLKKEGSDDSISKNPSFLTDLPSAKKFASLVKTKQQEKKIGYTQR